MYIYFGESYDTSLSSDQDTIFFFREFQPMTSAPDDSSLSSDQDTNQFLVLLGIKPQISYTTIRDFTS